MQVAVESREYMYVCRARLVALLKATLLWKRGAAEEYQSVSV